MSGIRTNTTVFTRGEDRYGVKNPSAAKIAARMEEKLEEKLIEEVAAWQTEKKSTNH